MTSRRRFLAGTAGAALGVAAWPRNPLLEPIVRPDDLRFLKGLALDTVRSATTDRSRSAMGFDAVTPGGDYPSLWIRDFSMAAGSGLIPAGTVRAHLVQIAGSQNGTRRRNLHEGATVPPWAVPDHVNFEGGSVFYPGTYSAGTDQGGEPFGVVPPVDDHYEFVHIASCTARSSRDLRFLDRTIKGVRLYDRLSRALETPRCDPKTGLVVTDAVRRAVGFGFCDTVYLTGSMAFPSLLRYRALGEMSELAEQTGQGADAVRWSAARAELKVHLAPVLQEASGWLLAATGVGRQPDVWATAFALDLGVLKGEARTKALRVLAAAFHEGTVTCEGAVRHVPTDRDFSETSAWERTAGVPLDRYQNGAYWHTPSGWFASALSQTDRSAARRFIGDYMAHMRREDHRQGRGHGGPWECVHPRGPYRQNPVYLASVTLPYEVFRRLR
ncbi:MAG: hypothetical protein JST30_09440 [Armatimonadetes bacterium]|nr:hypothetical protein [Armatimonadota bacterium]